MDKEPYILPLSKSLLAGLLTGIVAAVLNLIFMIIFRQADDFSRANIIMPFTIFVGFPILLSVAGYAYYLFQRHLPFGSGWFVIFCIAWMLALIGVTLIDTKGPGSYLSGVRGLFIGLEIITFVLAAFLIPYLAKHPKIYE